MGFSFIALAADLNKFAEGAQHMAELGSSAGQKASEFITGLAGKPEILVIGIALVIIAIVMIFFIKKIIINSILGLIAWAVLNYYFKIQLPFIPSLAVSLIFGLAGVGAMLVLKFFGLL